MILLSWTMTAVKDILYGVWQYRAVLFVIIKLLIKILAFCMARDFRLRWAVVFFSFFFLLSGYGVRAGRWVLPQAQTALCCEGCFYCCAAKTQSRWEIVARGILPPEPSQNKGNHMQIAFNCSGQDDASVLIMQCSILVFWQGSRNILWAQQTIFN